MAYRGPDSVHALDPRDDRTRTCERPGQRLFQRGLLVSTRATQAVTRVTSDVGQATEAMARARALGPLILQRRVPHTAYACWPSERDGWVGWAPIQRLTGGDPQPLRLGDVGDGHSPFT